MSDLDKDCILKVDKKYCFKVDCHHEWYKPHHPVFHPHEPRRGRRVLNVPAKLQGSSLNNAHLTGLYLLQKLIH